MDIREGFNHNHPADKNCIQNGRCDYGVYPLESRFYMDQVDLMQVRSILWKFSIILNTTINKESSYPCNYFFL